MKKVLCACEESQAVTKNLRNIGIEAYSCDIQNCSGGHPEWHIQEDVLPLLNGNCKFKTCDGIEHFVDGKWDAIFAFPPCFVAGTQVITYDGIKSIEDVQVGDLVLTHKGRFKKVLNVMSKLTTEIATVHSENCGYIECTPNHQFYVADITRSNNKRNIGKFEWKNPTEFVAERFNEDNIKSGFKCKTYTTCITDDIEELPKYDGYKKQINSYLQEHICNIDITDESFWYIVGRYLGDGYKLYKYEKTGRHIRGINICCGRNKTDYLKEMLDKMAERSKISYYLHHKHTADCFEIASTELGRFMEQFGDGADGKYIPGFAMRLPKELGISMLNGYFDSDGYIDSNNVYHFSTVSQKLAYGLKYMINKYYRVACSVKKTKQHTDVIEGRKVDTKDIYVSTFRRDKRTQSRYLNKDRYILAPFRSVDTREKNTMVYNLSVEDDESYTANGLIVHNCTHLANSGARHFEKKRADGRQREGIEFFCQFLNADCDHIAIENPMNIINGDYIKEHFPDLCAKYGLPLAPTQRIHPWMFGDNFSKTTCLWLKGLPSLVPEVTEEPEMEWFEWTDKKTGKKKKQNKWYYDALRNSKTAEERSRLRSKTFPGIARAFAEQWSKVI